MRDSGFESRFTRPDKDAPEPLKPDPEDPDAPDPDEPVSGSDCVHSMHSGVRTGARPMLRVQNEASQVAAPGASGAT